MNNVLRLRLVKEMSRYDLDKLITSLKMACGSYLRLEIEASPELHKSQFIKCFPSNPYTCQVDIRPDYGVMTVAGGVNFKEIEVQGREFYVQKEVKLPRCSITFNHQDLDKFCALFFDFFGTRDLVIPISRNLYYENLSGLCPDGDDYRIINLSTDCYSVRTISGIAIFNKSED